MIKLWQMLKNAVQQPAQKYTYVHIPRAQTDATYDDTPLRPNQSYMRVWLREMFLTRARNWHITEFPAVHASVNLSFGNQGTQTFTRVVQPPPDVSISGVLLNYELVRLMPYYGGTVEIDASLLALPGENYLATAIDVLQDFSSLVAPPLAQAIEVANTVSTSLDKLFASTNGSIHLPFHQTFVAPNGGPNDLRPGYIAVILGPTGPGPNTVIPDRLSVAQDRLYYKSSPAAPPTHFRKFDYMLLGVEGRDTREDYLQLSDIKQAHDRLYDAMVKGDDTEIKALRQGLLMAALRSPDLTVPDRRRVATALKEEYDQLAALGLGAAGDRRASLDKVIATYAMPVAQAAALGELDLDELLA
jgi:hypothetical protein